MTAAFTFPGQGSQAVGMGKALAEAFPAARAVFDVIAFEQTRKVTVDVGGEALEVTEFVEEGGRNDENLFFGHDGHGESFRWSGACYVVSE